MNNLFSKRLTDLREASNQSKTAIANILGIPRTTYSNYELGISEPDIAMLIKLSKLFYVSVDYLVGNDSKEKVFS